MFTSSNERFNGEETNQVKFTRVNNKGVTQSTQLLKSVDHDFIKK